MKSIINLYIQLRSKISAYRREDDGLAALEAALLFPILVVMCFGVVDIGHGIIINQKVTSASHMAADLLARKAAVSDQDIEDAVEAAKLAIDPYDRQPFGIDIASVEFTADDDGEVVWRYTENSTENENAVANSIGLGKKGEGVMVVMVKYEYTPYFYKMFFDNIKMTEFSYLRGRKSGVVRHEDMI